MTKKRSVSNINKQVWGIISSDFSLQRSLSRKILNIRALAKYIIDSYHLDVGLDAVISAIRRYETEVRIQEQIEFIKKAFKKSQLFTKDHVACITVKSRAFPDFSKKAHTIARNFRLIHSKKKSKIIVAKDDIEKVKDFFNPEHIIEIKENLGELRIVFPETPHEIKGLLAKITGELAINNISISECIVCFPEFLIYVNKKDLLNAHKTMLDLQN